MAFGQPSINVSGAGDEIMETGYMLEDEDTFDGVNAATTASTTTLSTDSPSIQEPAQPPRAH
jgi:hypothetical protein